jgi:transposase-like protein
LPRPKKSFSPEFKDEAVKMVIETSRPIARVAKELGINEGTLGNWVSSYRRDHAGEEPPLTVSERARLRELERETRELKMELEFMKKAAAYFRKSFDDSDETYGYRRVHADLAAWGVPCGLELVRSVMRELGLEPCQPKPWRFSLTEGDGQEYDIPDLVNRDFTAEAPGEKMVGDITYISTWQGWVYLNGVKLSGNGHQPEDDLGERGQPGALAGFGSLVPAAGALGLAVVPAAGALGYEVAREGDLEGQVGGEVVEAVRGKSIRSR